MANPSRPTFSPRLAIIVGAVVLVAAAAFAFFAPSRSGAPLIGGQFALQTADGKTVTDADLIGHPTLIYFGYTHCPDICPTTLAQISDVLGLLPDKPVKVLFITVDPDRDTPALMGDYVSSFDKRMVGLSGSPAQVEQTERVYRVYAKKAPEKNGEYAMDHSSVVYLMDRNGRFVEAFNLERSAADAAKELEKLPLKGSVAMSNHKILTDAEVETALKGAPGWKRNGKNIEATFAFETFRDAIAYIVLVGIEAEMMNHHPEFHNSYNVILFSFCTHDVGHKITDTDIKLAERLNEIAKRFPGVKIDHIGACFRDQETRVFVMAGLVPAIHVGTCNLGRQNAT